MIRTWAVRESVAPLKAERRSERTRPPCILVRNANRPGPGPGQCRGSTDCPWISPRQPPVARGRSSMNVLKRPRLPSTLRLTNPRASPTFAADLRAPVQPPVVELAHLDHPLHEPWKVLKLGPLVVDLAQGSVHDDRPLDLGHVHTLRGKTGAGQGTHPRSRAARRRPHPESEQAPFRRRPPGPGRPHPDAGGRRRRRAVDRQLGKPPLAAPL